VVLEDRLGDESLVDQLREVCAQYLPFDAEISRERLVVPAEGAVLVDHKQPDRGGLDDRLVLAEFPDAFLALRDISKDADGASVLIRVGCDDRDVRFADSSLPVSSSNRYFERVSAAVVLLVETFDRRRRSLVCGFVDELADPSTFDLLPAVAGVLEERIVDDGTASLLVEDVHRIGDPIDERPVSVEFAPGVEVGFVSRVPSRPVLVAIGSIGGRTAGIGATFRRGSVPIDRELDALRQ